MKTHLAVFCLILSGCFASAPPASYEPGDCKAPDATCPSGHVCLDGACRQLCHASDECGAVEACIGGICETYAATCGDGDAEPCADGWFCDEDNVCHKLRAIGSPCGARADVCATGWCVDGVCCVTECQGVCMSCTAVHTGSEDGDGSCAPVADGADPSGECGRAACDGSGACYNNESGAPCTHNYECSDGWCADGVCCSAACDGICETCVTGTCEAIPEGADPEDECAAEATCTGTRGCFGADLGGGCAASHECISGNCVDGVCCDGPCDSACERCNDPSAPGLCTERVNATDPGTCDATTVAGDCTVAPCTCDASGACKLSGAVTCEPTSASCSNGPCVGGICCDGACAGTCMSCNSDETGEPQGTCAPILVGNDPRGECPGAAACNGVDGCFARADADACELDYQCANGHCVEGLCCNTACTGACMACDGVGTGTVTAGTCGPILSGLDPNEECDGVLACNGSSACYDRVAGASCGENYECQDGSCCGGECFPAWTPMSSYTTVNLNGVWGTSSSNVFAVGDAGVIRRYTGSSDWASMSNPDTSSPKANLNGIHGGAANNIIAVGASGTILRFNGTGWSLMTSGTTATLNDVYVVASNLAYAAGDGVILKYNGSAWSSMTLPESGLNATSVGGVGGNVYLAGSIHVGHGYRHGLWHLVDSMWQSVPVPGGVTGIPMDVSGSSELGIVLSVKPDFLSGIIVYTTFDTDPQSTGGGGRAVSAVGTSLFAVASKTSSSAAGLHNDYEWVWQTPTSVPLRGVWAAGPCDAFAVGEGGVILRY